LRFAKRNSKPTRKGPKPNSQKHKQKLAAKTQWWITTVLSCKKMQSNKLNNTTKGETG
jgi:hypothetical protein